MKKDKMSVFFEKTKFYILFIILWIIVRFFFSGTTETIREGYSDDVYNGTVTDKFIDKNNHSYRIIILDSNTRVAIPPNSYELFDYIVLGDSLKKNDNSLKGYIVKKDTILVIDYEKSVPRD